MPTNLFLNSGFEEGANYWHLYGGAEVSDVDKYRGIASLHLYDGDPYDVPNANQAPTLPIELNKDYYFGFKYKIVELINNKFHAGCVRPQLPLGGEYVAGSWIPFENPIAKGYLLYDKKVGNGWREVMFQARAIETPIEPFFTISSGDDVYVDDVWLSTELPPSGFDYRLLLGLAGVFGVAGLVWLIVRK